tara:strand:+ start:250 stop:462 length:213 start_codon:yes stop_codon:yes gene_type:complete
MRVFTGHGNRWDEDDIPTCSFCSQDIDELSRTGNTLYDAPFYDIQFCDKDGCCKSLAISAQETPIEETEE